LTAYAVAGRSHSHVHLGGIFAIKFFKRQNVVGTDFEAAATADTKLLIY
jgi:hypothetical protein